MKKLATLFLLCASALTASAQTAIQILERIDRNMSSESRIFESTMTIHGKRNSRTLTSKSWAVGNKKAFTEYLSPASDKGTKMLKLDNQIWIYSPSTDRTIQISGHMTRQSVMGSDLSYEDMMDDRPLKDDYNQKIGGEEMICESKVWVIELLAKVYDVAYHSQKMWVDTERFIPLKQELYAKSGQLLKRMEMSEVAQIGSRWFPKTVVYKDMLKDGKGTEFRITSIEFDKPIPDYIFSKAALKQ